MLDKNVQIRKISEYLSKNLELREALGASPNQQLIPEFLGEGEHNLNFAFQIKRDFPTLQNAIENANESVKYVLRENVLPQPFHENQIRYEFGALKAIAPSRCTPLPVFADSSDKAPGNGILIETFCPGRQLDFDKLQDRDLRRCAKILAEIHSVEIDGDCTIHRPRDPLVELFNECAERFEVYRSSPYEDTRITKWADRLTELTATSIDDVKSSMTHDHIVNTEPLASHFLLPDNSDSGWFVDWERPIIGEVSQDLAFFLAPTTTFWDSDYLYPKGLIEPFLKDYWAHVDRRFDKCDFETRFLAWLKVSILRAIAWCCKALIRYGDKKGHLTQKAAQKIPVYLSDDFLEMLLTEYFL